jgi:ribosomal protein S18 acetylase RimI-like enzyme
MCIRYQDRLETVKEEAFIGFFDGWLRKPTTRQHLKILQNSYKFWLAMENDKCVGFINALSDGFFYATIPMLEVLPDYQNRGIGTALLSRMIETLHDMYGIDLVCDETLSGFYLSRGFSACIGMIRRNYNER